MDPLETDSAARIRRCPTTSLCVISSMRRRVEETLASGADFDERFAPVTLDLSGCIVCEGQASWPIAEILKHPVEQVGKLRV